MITQLQQPTIETDNKMTTTPFTRTMNKNLVTIKTIEDERSIKTIYKVYDFRVVVETSFDGDSRYRKFYRSMITHYQLDLLLTNHTVGRKKTYTQQRDNNSFIYASDDMARFNYSTLVAEHNNALLVAQSSIAQLTNDYVTQLFDDVKNTVLMRYFNEPVMNNATLPYPFYQVSA